MFHPQQKSCIRQKCTEMQLGNCSTTDIMIQSVQQLSIDVTVVITALSRLSALTLIIIRQQTHISVKILHSRPRGATLVPRSSASWSVNY